MDWGSHLVPTFRIGCSVIVFSYDLARKRCEGDAAAHRRAPLTRPGLTKKRPCGRAAEARWRRCAPPCLRRSDLPSPAEAGFAKAGAPASRRQGGPQRGERAKARGLRWGEMASPGRCGACPTRPPQQRRCRCGGWMRRHRAAHRAYPGGHFAAIKRVNIEDLWYRGLATCGGEARLGRPVGLQVEAVAFDQREHRTVQIEPPAAEHAPRRDGSQRPQQVADVVDELVAVAHRGPSRALRKAAMAEIASAQFPLVVRPEALRGARPWSPSSAQCRRTAGDRR